MLLNFKMVLAVKGEKQVDFAIRNGMDPALLSMVINERRKAAPELRAKLAAALGVSERWLFQRHVRPAPPTTSTHSNIGASAAVD